MARSRWFRSGNFYPRPPCGGRPVAASVFTCTTTHFYPRPPCGGRQGDYIGQQGKTGFLSTSPLRGTTVTPWQDFCGRLHFYPRPPCGGRRCRTHRPEAPCPDFYPRPPCGGRLKRKKKTISVISISIHVPLAGDDCICPCAAGRGFFYFYPRPPCGGRHLAAFHGVNPRTFLSTSPLRGTTDPAAFAVIKQGISIHVPLAGDDLTENEMPGHRHEFLSTSPLRGTTYNVFRDFRMFEFLSTSPLRGTT